MKVTIKQFDETCKHQYSETSLSKDLATNTALMYFIMGQILIPKVILFMRFSADLIFQGK